MNLVFSTRRFAHTGPAEDGELIHLEATPDEHRVLGQIQSLDGQTWNNLCLSGDRLLVRNGQEAACYQLTLADGK